MMNSIDHERREEFKWRYIEAREAAVDKDNCTRCFKNPAIPGDRKHLCDSCKGINPTSRMRDKVIRTLGPWCAKCGEHDIDILEIDHIYGGGNLERKSFEDYYKYYKNMLDLPEPFRSKHYQILCANHNWKKRSAKSLPLPQQLATRGPAPAVRGDI
jgi:hypothetical protein